MPGPKVDSTMQRPLADPVGQTVAGGHRIERLLGRGGVGAVYEAVHVETSTRRAIKMLLPDLANAAEVAERFKREAMAARLLDHPNIVEVIDLVAEGPDLYLVMELLSGRPLTAILEDGALAPRRALVIGRQILDALAHAHTHGLVHRDLKPANIMLVTLGTPGAEFERVKLLDFGLVKLVGETAALLGDTSLTQTGVVFGTPAYISPEQALGRPVDARSDLYSLGIVLFEMLAGRPPFRSPDPVTLTRMHAAAPVPTLASVAPGRPWCTPALEHLIARALAKKPDDRFATATEMTTALDAAFVSLDAI
ncbi:MAG TPA: serine/threonine-protein kinase [Kofleriaceae bacterium]